MKLDSSELPADRADVLHSKYVYGIWFGLVVGLTFSIFAWGATQYDRWRLHWLAFSQDR